MRPIRKPLSLIVHLVGILLHRLREQRVRESCLHLMAQLSRLDDPAGRPSAELVSRLTAPRRLAWDPTDPLERLWLLPARRRPARAGGVAV